MLRIALIILLCMLLSSCATSYGERGISGGVEDDRIDASTYRIRAVLNGFSNGGMYKPYITARAKDIAASQGFSSARVDRLDYFVSPNGALMSVIVRFATHGGECWSDDWRCLPIAQPAQSSAVGLTSSGKGQTTLRPSDESRRIGNFIRVTPIFISATEAESPFFGRSTIVLKPGRHEFVASIEVPGGLARAGQHFTLPVLAELVEGRAYVVNASREGDDVVVWVSDEKTNEPAGPKSRVKS